MNITPQNQFSSSPALFRQTDRMTSEKQGAVGRKHEPNLETKGGDPDVGAMDS